MMGQRTSLVGRLVVASVLHGCVATAIGTSTADPDSSCRATEPCGTNLGGSGDDVLMVAITATVIGVVAIATYTQLRSASTD